jgi:tRNA dimethylallyltransferase
MKRGTLVIVVGPTAVGKTTVAVRLARHFQTDVISADSRQVFRELVIGTAKPGPEERAAAVHHFVDSRSVFEPYDAGSYATEVMSLLDRLFETHTHAILSGGSGLYIKALLEGFDELPEIPERVRKSVVAEYESRGLAGLQEELLAKDPDYFDAVDRKNPQRLMRAIEVIRHSGKPFSGFHNKTTRTLPFEVIKIGLERPREELYSRIDARMDGMIHLGLFEEAAKLFPHRQLPALQTVGYQEIFGHLEGKYDREEAIRLLKRNSRRYAKRQLTWFRKDKSIAWFHPDDWQGVLSRCTASE